MSTSITFILLEWNTFSRITVLNQKPVTSKILNINNIIGTTINFWQGMYTKADNLQLTHTSDHGLPLLVHYLAGFLQSAEWWRLTGTEVLWVGSGGNGSWCYSGSLGRVEELMCKLVVVVMVVLVHMLGNFQLLLWTQQWLLLLLSSRAESCEALGGAKTQEAVSVKVVYLLGEDFPLLWGWWWLLGDIARVETFTGRHCVLSGDGDGMSAAPLPGDTILELKGGIAGGGPAVDFPCLWCRV